jgi:hypothetical protein
MAKSRDGKGLKSLGAGKPMRSRGFLSHPGGSPRQGADDVDAQAVHETKSRGTRQITASVDGKPSSLSAKPAIKPYRLEDE